MPSNRIIPPDRIESWADHRHIRCVTPPSGRRPGGFRHHVVGAAVAAALAGGLMSPTLASAKTVTWTGGAAFVSTDWLYAFNGFTNWLGNQQPANGDSLVFDGVVGLTNTNNSTNLSIADLTLATNAGAFTLYGNGLTVNGNVTNNSSHPQTINLPVTVGATGKTWDGGSQGLQLSGAFTLGNNSLTLNHKIALDNAGGVLLIGDAGTATLTLAGGSSANGNSSILGYSAGKGTLTVTGAGSTWTNSAELVVGNSGSGTLNIQNGGKVSNANAYLGYFPGSTGTVTVTGAGSTWASSDTLYVGNFGDCGCTLNLKNGGTVSARNISIGSRSAVNLDGGVLTIGSATLSAGAVFNWTNGTLNYTGNASLGNGWAGLDRAQSLTAGQTLQVGGTLTVGAGRVLLLAGGQVKSQALSLPGGTIVASTGLDVSETGSIAGHGTISGAIGGGAGKSITASGGGLTLGNAASMGGFNFAGALDAGSNQVILLSADKAQLGSSTHLGAGGNLSAVNGVDLQSGRSLSFAGDASILGNFTNNGAVSGSGGALTFLNDVNGAGSFAGNIVFHAGYSPGNSPATVSFNAGNATYDGTSVLTLEILGAAPGSGHDQLVDIDHLSFDGTLQLVFGGGYVPVAGTRFTLFDFQSFSGSLSPGHIQVVGFDAAKLDFSLLSTNGTLSVAAVPEPETTALMLAGLGLVGWAARRRRPAAV